MPVTGYAPTALVQGIQRQPLPYGLFSVLSFRPGTDRWHNGVKWESGTCEPVGTLGTPDCGHAGGRTTGPGWPKKLDANGSPVGEALPFTVYGHYTCSAPSHTVEEAEALARQHLVTREEAAVEHELWTGEMGSRNAFEASEAKTLGTLGPVAGLSSLEDFIAQNYGSLGVLHMSRSVATVLVSRQLLTTSGGRLTTVLGTPVVAGSGYPSTGDIYATPALMGYRSDIFSPSSERGDLIDRGTNTLTAIAERSYVLGYDPCGLAVVTIDPSK